MKPKRIVLVDDSPRDIDAAVGALEQHQLGGDVVVLRDGVDALDYLYRRARFAERDDTDPAVIILDLRLPRIDGLEVLRQIKTDPRLKVIPVVVLTVSREEQHLVDSYRLGVNAYVVKPLALPALADAIKVIGVFWASLNEPPRDALTSA